MELRSVGSLGQVKPPTFTLSSIYKWWGGEHFLYVNAVPWWNNCLVWVVLELQRVFIWELLLHVWICFWFVQGDADVWRRCLHLLLLCLQLQRTQWSCARVWRSGGRFSPLELTPMRETAKNKFTMCFFPQHAAREEILANGGSLSHHHGGTTLQTT